MNFNCAKWKATQTPKPLAFVAGSSQSSEGDLDCDGVLDNIRSSPECALLVKTRLLRPLLKRPVDLGSD